jgi:hypothetical protein
MSYKKDKNMFEEDKNRSSKKRFRSWNLSMYTKASQETPAEPVSKGGEIKTHLCFSFFGLVLPKKTPFCALVPEKGGVNAARKR